MKLLNTFSNEDAAIVTGYIDSAIEGKCFLHSWLEIGSSEDGNTVVIDPTINAIFAKNDYYNFRNAQPKAVFNREQLNFFFNLFNSDSGQKYSELGIKEILLFADDIIPAIKEKEGLSNKEFSKFK